MKTSNNPFANVEWMGIVYEIRDGLERQPKPYDDVEECSMSSSLGGATVAYKLVRRRENRGSQRHYSLIGVLAGTKFLSILRGLLLL